MMSISKDMVVFTNKPPPGRKLQYRVNIPGKIVKEMKLRRGEVFKVTLNEDGTITLKRYGL